MSVLPALFAPGEENASVGVVTNSNSLTSGKNLAQHKTTLSEAFQAVPICSLAELSNSFMDQLNMKLYHAAEFEKKGGGIQYLVTRAFQKTTVISSSKVLANEMEADWHFDCFVQHMGLNEHQRVRQARITQAADRDMFNNTKHLAHKEFNRFYGRSNMHTLWNTLPIPTVHNVGGIAYVNPVNAIRYWFANGTEVDDCFFKLPLSEDPPQMAPIFDENATIHHIAQCRAFHEWKVELYSTTLKNADESFRKRFPYVLMCWAVDWRDGFGANRTKQNRKSTNAWTFSLATPASRVNSLSNTLPIALGLKSNAHWKLVENCFLDDLKVTGNGLTPLFVYHGKERKVVPVLVRRLACLTDKVERGDYTATISCTSKFHRCFGKIVRFDPPTLETDGLSKYLEIQKKGLASSEPPQLMPLQNNHYGWSNQFVNQDSNGGRFPACLECRKKTLAWLRKPNFDALPDRQSCEFCANWVIDKSTKDVLMFDAPKDYPPEDRCLPDCPIDPPEDREPGLKKLVPIDLAFDTLIKAGRYAFFHSRSGGRNSGWTKAMYQAYLRSCGWNQKETDLLYAAAIHAYKNNVDVDYKDIYGLATYQFPAAWIGDMSIDRFIEMLMHLLFLGVGESNFKLSLLYMQKTGRAEMTFKKAMQELLKKLNKYNLSWLLIQPFSGKALTTGTWVSENELAWIQISKVAYAYCVKRGDTDLRLGSHDLLRMVCAFNGLVARVLSHAGCSKWRTVYIKYLLKEFLSCVRELDVRTRYKKMDQFARTGNVTTSTAAEDKSGDPWWLKSNYVSCLNLTPTMDILGPLINFWDGGGKGERYIQEIKPHIPRGVRDGGNFFIRLLERVLKTDDMAKIDSQRFSTDSTSNTCTSPGSSRPLIGSSVSGSDDEQSVSNDDSSADASQHGEEFSVNAESAMHMEVAEDNAQAHEQVRIPPVATVTLAGTTIRTDVNDEEDSASALSYDGDPDEEEAEKGLQDLEMEEQWSTPMEEKMMEKARTYYVYRRKSDLDDALNRREPITGILVRLNDGSPQMYAIYKVSGKQFGWYRVLFDDTCRIQVCNLWYAPLTVEEANAPPSSTKEITRLAKVATVAIPLQYSFGSSHTESSKYCVLTNWWRERNSRGQYVLPTVAFELYN